MKKEKKVTSSFKIVIVTFFMFILSGASIAFASEISSEKMVELTNISREENNLEKLIVSEELYEVALAKAYDMFDNQYFDHTSPEGITPWYWFDKIGYNYVYAAENLAIDFQTAEGTHRALMDSTGHRENILGINYTEIGIAVVSGLFDGRETVIVVEEFGSTKKVTKNSETFFERLEIVPEVASANDEKDSEEDIFQNYTQEIDDIEEGIVPKIFSVKRPLVLKKVFSEDIYWEENENLISATSYRMRIRNIIDQLIS